MKYDNKIKMAYRVILNPDRFPTDEEVGVLRERYPEKYQLIQKRIEENK